MNQISFRTNQLNLAMTNSYGFSQSGWSSQVGLSAGTILGSSGTSSTPLMSSLMQSLFSGGSPLGMSNFFPQQSPFSNFFQQMGSGQFPGFMNPQLCPPSCGNTFGGQHYGGYSCDPNYFSQSGSQYGCPSGCQDFGFGQQSPQACCDYRNQGVGCHQTPSQCNQDGQLSQEAEGKPISYTTSGGYTIDVNGSTINITDPSGETTMKTWGDPHENINGEHVSDWQDKQRTLLLDDGTKITMGADNPKGVVENMSIYDGRQSVQIDNTKNEVTGHSFNPYETNALERNQYDGSTAYFQTRPNGSSSFANIYNQDENFQISRDYQLIATTDRDGAVTDHFDDPTHKNT